ncbi:MerR-family transcriptional regulator [Streptomyces hygroscopicus subsp. jinggangensis 5008]|uniref:MerR family transcriptional regulator n=1 Tax=Streptomyces olivaceoviridis TaxID=1921 RepID=UPI00024BD16B|nr:MerR-family transcriptional regulator [Streptomyces hygroscopicus subsp. jinggangensis 5008]AGF64951.1 MerR-family transcriptional regulator [Streptomyces hygroscopicus subsp. jinggangensis TL01]ALO95248.1 MerR-family transcriptional regulator [Streptomyces hygroscopicus subsp. limoneus]
MSYSVGQVAGFAGVTVRTLHHYDEIGLLVPSERTYAGHRRYSDTDLDRLQQILFYRELGFPLDEVAALLDDPDADPRTHLRRQHDLLTARIEKLQKMAAAVEHALEARTMGIDLTPEERFEVFGDKDPEQYAEEAERRWGGTEAYAESQRRAATYTKEDWKRIQAEVDDWGERYAALVAAGEQPAGEAAMDLAEEHRRHIGRYYFEVPYEMHRCFAEMYVSDERFKAFYDSMRPGLAEHLRDAILANADRHTAP